MKKIFYLFSLLFLGCQQGPPDEESFQKMDQIGKELSKKYELRYLNSSIGALVSSEKCLFAMSLTSSQKMTLEEGQVFVSKLIKDFLAQIHQAGVFKDYIEKYGKCEFSEEQFGFKVAFWDENVDRPLPPYLAQIRFAENKVYFYYADSSTQALTEPVIIEIN